MKKIYLAVLTLGLGITVNAQSYDLSVALDNYTNGQATSDNPLDMTFTITNEGVDIPSGDSIYFVLTDGTETWTVDDLTPGYVMYTVLSATFASGASAGIPVVAIDMQWVYDNIGLTANLCVATLGVNAGAATPPTMINLTDDQACVSYTVTQVLGLEGIGMAHMNVYPNPASEVVNFQVGNNTISHINVYDMTGKLVSTILVNNTIETVNTDVLGAGVFFYQMMNGEEMVKTDKFVVAK